MKKILVSFSGFLALFFIWQFASHFSKHLLFVLPAPLDVAKTLIECHSRLLFHSLCTLKEMVGGFVFALTAAFPLAWIMMQFKTSRAVLQPFFIIVQCLPMFTLAPLMVLWFGWSYTAIVIPTALMIFFPLTLNIYQGLRSTPVDLLEFFQVNQATLWQSFFKLQLPWALPHIFAGFRISAAIAGIGAIAGEWAGAQNGLGMLMLESRRNTDLEVTFSALACLTCLSACFYGVVLFLEKIFLSPHLKRSLLKVLLIHHRFPLKKRNWALALLFIAFFFLFASSCQREKPSVTRLVLDWLPNPNHIPLYVGIEKQFFLKEGIEISLQKMHESGGGISYLTSGQADLLISHLPSALRASSRGAQIKIVGTLIKEPLNALIYLKNDSIQKPSDLSNHILGYCLGGPDTAFLDFLLKEGEILPKERLNVSVDLISAIGTQSVDCIYGAFWNIEPFQLHSLGVETDFFKIQQFNVPSYYEMIILGTIGSLQTSSFFQERFQRALQKSIDFCKQNPEEAFKCYLIHNQDKREKNIAWEKEAWRATYPLLADDQTIDPTCIEHFYTWLLEQNILKHSFDFQRLLY